MRRGLGRVIIFLQNSNYIISLVESKEAAEKYKVLCSLKEKEILQVRNKT